MIFVFDEEKPRAFWMKNTLIPLDMIFLDDELNVINILTATPCEREPCRLYRSSGPARYVLEINGGLAEKKGIVVGSKMSLTERE